MPLWLQETDFKGDFIYFVIAKSKHYKNELWEQRNKTLGSLWNFLIVWGTTSFSRKNAPWNEWM